ncbi:type III secretion system outer membrane ring subunit SctC [Pantoea eucrina]|uniref:type III secretion system outer membrane ring subunit SctC n=2 Tax=Pantoea TaxID=53335 RepID=UPI003CF8B1DE
MKSPLFSRSMLFMLLLPLSCTIAAETYSGQTATSSEKYVSNKDNARAFFETLSTRLKKPVVLSALASKKRITGSFDLANPLELLKSLTAQLGLVWYQDGQTFYIYDASEIKNVVITLKSINVNEFKNFLIESSLYDRRFPLQTRQGTRTFYVSGPPVYLDIIAKAAAQMDMKEVPGGNMSGMAIIPLRHSFSEDRTFKYRDQTLIIPGMASVIRALISNDSSTVPQLLSTRASAPGAPPATEPGAGARVMPPFPGELTASASLPASATASRQFQVVSNPDTNSVLVKGAPELVEHVRQVVNALDKPKRHVEMSVWIIDIQKEQLDQLGVRWSGSLSMGNSFGASFNGGISSTVDGASFVARIMALSQNKKANIVSRPMILTQENVPAIFDNNRTFYTKVVGERTAELQHVTYGTSLSVLPRFSGTNEIEMMLNVEDGNQYREQDSEMLPEVGRTNISTIARVPVGKSLVIGGYTRDEQSAEKEGIPVLQHIPLIGNLMKYSTSKNANLVRIFLIQPREVDGAQNDNALLAKARQKGDTGELTDWMNNFLDNR